MSRLIALAPVSKLAQHLTGGEPITTIEGETLLPDGRRAGPLCPICSAVMVKVVMTDPHLVVCPTSSCFYWRAPFRSPVAVVEEHNAAMADPV